jgi:glycosyltransferase involved in cell wall biosynthesis
MWWETPVVATAIFGLPDLIDHGRTGWLFPPRDVAALAGALDAALSASAQERHAIARAARALVQERYDVEGYAADVGAMLDELADARRRRMPSSITSLRLQNVKRTSERPASESA